MGLSPVRSVLDNGAVLLAKRAAATPAVAVNVSLGAGSACDPPDAAGTSWLLSRVIDRGTTSRSGSEIAEELDSRGISLTTSVTRHVMALTCNCLAEDFGAVLELVGEIVMMPALPDPEIVTRKREVVTAIRQDQDSPAVRATEALMSHLYPDGHPYGRPTKGTIETVQRLGRGDLQRIHYSRFGPSTLTVVIVGDIDPSRAQETAARVFGGWRQVIEPRVGVPPVRRPVEREQIVIPMMNKSQADIAYGFVAIRRADPDYYAHWLMNIAFGQFALGGRLGDSIRERQGMAYYVSSQLEANIAEGPLFIRAGISPANIDRAIASIDHEIVRLTRDGLTQTELDESRQYLIGAMPRALETNAGIAGFLQNEDLFHLGLDYDERLPDLLRAVTLDEANSAARRILDVDRATVVVAGPIAVPTETAADIAPRLPEVPPAPARTQ